MSPRRPWKVFVHDIGPTWTFATAERAHAKAQQVMAEEHYALITVYSVDESLRRTAYRHDRPPVVEEFRQVEVKGYGLIYQWVPAPIWQVTALHESEPRYRSEGRWLVVTRKGDLVQGHRFKTEAEARAFAGTLTPQGV